MKSKLDLIAKASKTAPLKRVVTEAKPVVKEAKILRQNQSFSITPDIADLIASLRKGSLSKAVKTALLHADKKGLLNDFKG